MFDILTAGIILGLSAGLAPGPLLALVIAETLQHNVAAGIKVALAPLLTDLPLILVTLLVLSQLVDAGPVLGLISIVGGLFLLFLGYENLRSTGILIDQPPQQRPNSLMKGALANVLSPYPYLFWFTVGAPLLAKAMRLSPVTPVLLPVLFVVSFYACLVGSKILLAILVGRSKTALSSRVLTLVFRLIGVLMCVLAFGLLRDGLALLSGVQAAV